MECIDYRTKHLIKKINPSHTFLLTTYHINIPVSCGKEQLLLCFLSIVFPFSHEEVVIVLSLNSCGSSNLSHTYPPVDRSKMNKVRNHHPQLLTSRRFSLQLELITRLVVVDMSWLWAQTYSSKSVIDSQILKKLSNLCE